MKIHHLLTIFCFVMAVLADASGSEISAKVKTGTHRPFFWYLNVHASEISWLKVCGKKYTHIKGYKPNYLEIDNLNAIFFITDTGTSGSEEIAHFVGVDGKIKCEIRFSDYIYIGSSSTPVSIVSSQWPIVVVKSAWPEFIEVFEFNLSTKSYTVKREAIQKSGNTENQKAPNQSLETTTMAVTPAASHPSRQP